MVRNRCPTCGAVTDDQSQKFCTQCGTKLPELPASAARGKSIPAWAAATVGILVIIVIAAVFWQPLMLGLAGNVAGGYSGPGTLESTAALTDITPLPSGPMPSLNASPTISTTLTTASTTSAPATVMTTMMTTVTTSKTTQTTTTTLPTATPTPESTAQITLSVTRVPAQPPSDTYTSKTEGAPYIDPFSLEARIHELINIQRQQNGLSTLSYDSFLASIARGHSYDMSLRNFFEHVNPDGMNARARGEWAGYPCVRDYGRYYTEGISENIALVYRYDEYRDLIAPNGTIVETEYFWSTEDYIANKVVNGWMNSEGHRNNILDYHFQQEGIGIAFASDNGIYITENFC
jgi:uncharacterized protein YkwD